jgi:hypothetical protein
MRSRPSGRSRLADWWAIERGRVTLVLIAGLALGGIACMGLVVLALIVSRQ